MILYKYKNDTKELLGYLEAYLDELETIAQGKEVYVMPPNTTTIEPFKPREGYTVVFKEDKWEEIEDNRGLKVYNKKGEELVIEELGAIPTGYSMEKPLTLKESKDEKLKELKSKYNEALEAKIGKLNVKICEASELRALLDKYPEEYSVLVYKDEPVKRGDIEKLIKELYIREMLLAKRKGEYVKEIMRARSVKSAGEIEIAFDIDKEVKKLVKLSVEELNKEFD
jgi:hypothetical protein